MHPFDMGMAIPLPGDEQSGDVAWSAREAPRPSSADEAMDRYATGDSLAFEIVFDEIAPELERFFESRVDCAQTPELIAATLLTMHRMRGTFIRGSAVLPWALAIASRLLDDA